MSEYDSISDFLVKRRGHLKKLADALDKQCEWGVVQLIRGQEGLTFILPPDDVVEGLIADLNGSDEKIEAAVLTLADYVIPLHLPNADAWRGRAVRHGGVGTRSGRALPDPAESKPGKTSSRLKIGEVTIKPDKRFASKHPISVWAISGDGAWSPTDRPWTPPRPESPKKKPARRAAKVDRMRLISDLGHGWARAMRSTMGQGFLPQYARDPFLVATVGLFDFLREKDPEAYRAVLPLSSPSPAITFCIAIGLRDSLISDRTLATWLRQENVSDERAREGYLEHLTTGLETVGGGRGDTPKVCTREGQKQLAEARIRASGKAPANQQRALMKYIKKIYKTLAASNTLDGVGPIYPSATLRHLGPEGIRSAVLSLVDSFRFVIGTRIYSLFASPDRAGEVPDDVIDLFDRTVPSYFRYNSSDSADILNRTLMALVPRSPADMKPAFHILKFYTHTDAFVAFPEMTMLEAAIKLDPTPEGVTEILKMRTLPSEDPSQIYTVNWTLAHLQADNTLRGLYRMQTRRRTLRKTGTGATDDGAWVDSSTSEDVAATGAAASSATTGDPVLDAALAEAEAEAVAGAGAADASGAASDSSTGRRRHRRHRKKKKKSRRYSSSSSESD